MISGMKCSKDCRGTVYEEIYEFDADLMINIVTVMVVSIMPVFNKITCLVWVLCGIISFGKFLDEK